MKTMLAMLLALVVVSASAAEEVHVKCDLTSKVLMQEVGGTKLSVHVAVSADCDNGFHKLYESRSASIDVTAPKEIGALLLRAMANEVAKAMQADGAPMTADEILEHAALETVEP